MVSDLGEREVAVHDLFWEVNSRTFNSMEELLAFLIEVD
jgi:hypothetical protein